MALSFVFTLFLSFVCYSYALYFHIGETEKKCFIEDIPDETMVVGEVVNLICVCIVSSWQQHRTHSDTCYLLLVVDGRRSSVNFNCPILCLGDS